MFTQLQIDFEGMNDDEICLIDFPDHLLNKMFHYLNHECVFISMFVCKTFHKAINKYGIFVHKQVSTLPWMHYFYNFKTRKQFKTHVIKYLIH